MSLFYLDRDFPNNRFGLLQAEQDGVAFFNIYGSKSADLSRKFNAAEFSILLRFQAVSRHGFLYSFAMATMD
jgi:hypothetical protein